MHCLCAMRDKVEKRNLRGNGNKIGLVAGPCCILCSMMCFTCALCVFDDLIASKALIRAIKILLPFYFISR